MVTYFRDKDTPTVRDTEQFSLFYFLFSCLLNKLLTLVANCTLVAIHKDRCLLPWPVVLKIGSKQVID